MSAAPVATVKVLHTSDWHLGARLGRIDRQPDQQAALSALVKHAEERRPDLIVHSGDLFDAARPPYPAMDLAVLALRRLSAVAPTVVLAGNHDSPALLRVLHDFSGLSEPRRLWFVTEPDVLTFTISQRDVALACVPFVHPNAAVNLLDVDPARYEGTYADVIRDLNATLITRAAESVDPTTGVVLYAAHLHVHGAQPAKSERRITVGDDFAAHVTGLERVVYAAFGHIHDPQLLPGGNVRGEYAGSLVPIDFGEASQAKRAVLVTIDADDRTVDHLPLPPGRRLVQVNGSLEDLRSKAEVGALDGVILKAAITSDDPITDLADQVVAMAPNAAVFDLVNVVRNTAARPIKERVADGATEPPLEQMFREWQTTTPARNANPERVATLFERLLGGVGADVVADLGVSDALGAVDAALTGRVRD